MNEQERIELERLMRRQDALQAQVATLSAEIRELSSRLEAGTLSEIQALNVPPMEIPPLIATELSHTPSPESIPPARELPPPVPPARPTAASPVSELSLTGRPVVTGKSAVPPPVAGPVPVRETFEMKLGTYWLVRVGIVMLLTGLVFLGTYAYKNFIGKLGPGGKVALLYAAGAALLGFGGWWQRKRENESLRNYGQVLFAGGLALVYFTTYAAHHIALLRIIASPVVDALLLLGLSAVTVWIADRRKSEVLALFAIALSYYTSAITSIGLFTLYSNLVLAAAAVFFLMRHRWVTLSFVSVFATYGGFAFWRFHGADWDWAARLPELWHANFFLAGYWLFFTAAVLFSRRSSMVNANRALFASLNNGAFVGLTLLSTAPLMAGNFWKFALGFGAALLGTAWVARRALPDEPIIKNTYLVQGLVLVTAGFIAYFTGLKLALLLAAESVVLIFLGHQQKNVFVRAGGFITAALSVAWVAMALTGSRGDVLLGGAIAGGFLLNAWFEHINDRRREASVIRPASGYFVALALGVVGWVTWRAIPEPWRAVAWMVEAVAFTGLFYAVRIPELPLFSQGLCIAAQGYWFFETALHQNRPHWIVPASLAGGTLALSHWWQRQKRLSVAVDFQHLLQIIYGLSLVAVLFFWFQPQFGPAAWLGVLSLLAMGVTLYGVVTRAWALAACAQIFLLASSFELLQQFTQDKPLWHIALIPLATWLVLGIATTAWLARHDTRAEVRGPLLQVSTFYRGVAFLMSLWWIYGYVSAASHFWALCAAGLGVLGVAGWLKNREALVFSGGYLAVAFAVWFTSGLADPVVINWPNLLAILALLAVQQVVRHRPQQFLLPPHAGAIVVTLAGLALWLFVSRRIVLESGGGHFFLTASWAGLAFLFFAIGFVLRDRIYRWLGLGILACAVVRVFLSDVWKLETIYRILSFMALGVVLLTLGFIYNKYQEKIRQWL